MFTGQPKYWAYLFTGLASCFLCFGAFFFVARTDWYSRHNTYPGLRNLGFGVRAHHLDCEVLLWGDSAALTGLDPRIISQKTGLTACNSSEGLTTQLVVGSDLPLRSYLDGNAPPRIIVGMWSYAKFRPDVPPHTTYTIEGMYYGLRYIRPARFLAMLAMSGHPHWVPRYLLWAAERLNLWPRQGPRPDAQEERARNGGLYQFPRPPETRCVTDPGVGSIQDWTKSVSAFRTKYSTPNTLLLVDISPIPDCNKYMELYKKTTEGLHDNPLLPVPIRYFNDSDIHFSPEGSRFVSDQVAQQILLALKQKSRQGSSNPVP